MVIIAFLLIVDLGVLLKALWHRSWPSAAAVALVGYVTAGLLARSVRADWPLIPVVVERGIAAVIAVLVVLPGAVFALERARRAVGTSHREVAELVALVAILNFASLAFADVTGRV